MYISLHFGHGNIGPIRSHCTTIGHHPSNVRYHIFIILSEKNCLCWCKCIVYLININLNILNKPKNIIYLYNVSLVLIAAISIIFDSKSSTQSPKKPNWAYELMSLMLKDTPKIGCLRIPHYQQNLVVVKKRWLLNKIKWSLEKKTVFHCNEWWATSLLILILGLFEIIAQSAHGSAIHFVQCTCTWRLSGNGCFWTFCTLGYCGDIV